MQRFPHEFSGGSASGWRARALVLKPQFILLDEPTSALDLSIQAQIIDLLRALRASHDLSYLFISHDLKVVKALCHRVMVMQHGNVIETGPTEQVLEAPQTEYTRRLVQAALMSWRKGFAPCPPAPFPHKGARGQMSVTGSYVNRLIHF
ncbi:MAG: hypothetical protein R3E89_19960 [Thiolinea sp.]